MSVSPATAVVGSVADSFAFAFRNLNRGSFHAGSQLELSVPAGWTAPQASDPSGAGYVNVASISGTAAASIASVSGTGPWTVRIDFTAGKGVANGFDLAYSDAASSAAGTFAFPVRTRQAGGSFVAIAANPVVEVTQAQAVVTLGDLIQTYDGTPRAVTVVTVPQGLAVAVTYAGSPTAPVATGVYAVVATVTDPAFEGSAAGTLVIQESGGGQPVFGRETFDYFTYAGSGYESGTFLGQDGSTWTYAKARGDLGIAGHSPTLEKAKGSFIRSGAIPGGLGTISLKYRKAAVQNVACGVLVNGTLAGTITGGDGTVQTWTSGPVDIPGDVVLLLTNDVNGGAITVDDVEWTGCKAPAAVALADLAQTYDGMPRIVGATTAPAGLAVEMTYDGSAAAPVAAGTYAVVATVVDDTYAGSASGTLTVAKADQAIAFAEIADPAEFQTLNLSAVAASGLPVSFAVGYGPAEIAENGASLSFSETGRVSIVASQAGDGNWNAAPAVTREFEVLPALALSADQINVRENGEGRLFVRLNGAPASNVVVAVARVGGDADLRVKSGSTLTFGPANWDWWQAATLAATNDVDETGGTATFRVSLPGCEPQLASAKELDDDVGENLALATNGATISGGSNAGRSIDGIHAGSANYGSTVWTNAPPGAMTLALKAPSIVSRIRVLNWNWLYPVLHRYTIESSMDGTNWTMLVDARAEDRHGWDDWEVPEQAARYLRFTGLSNSANRLVCVSEWEVFGKRIPAPAAVILQNLRQTYDGTPKHVAVETDPPNLPVEVAYDTVPSRRSARTLEPILEAGTEPPVAAGVYAVLAEVATDDYEGYAEGTLVVEMAGQTLSFPNPGPQSALNRVELRADASSGLPVSYAVTAGPAALDETGARLTFSGTGTVSVVASQAGDENWEPASDVEVSFEVRCPGLCFVLSKTNVNVREGGEGRFFVRLNMAPESNVVVAVSRLSGSESVSISNEVRTFKPTTWDQWQAVTLTAPQDENAEEETALFRVSAVDMPDQYLAATVLDADVGENLALSAAVRGATPLVNDGIHTVSTNYVSTKWMSVPAGTMTMDLQTTATVSRIRLLNWDWSYRVHQYRIQSSVDGKVWTTVADASTGEYNGWDDWVVADQAVRYLRFTGLSNSANSSVCIAEWEVYGARPVAKRSLAPAKTENLPVSASAEAGGFFLESEPVSVLTSDGVGDETGWNAVDGDEETAWVGQKAGGGYVVVEYQPALELSALEVVMAEGSLTHVQYLYSTDAQNWQPLPDDLESNPISLNYLWLVFPDDGTAAVPHVLEIVPNP